MCRWILRIVFTDNLPGRGRLVQLIFQTTVKRKKLDFGKIMLAVQHICLLSLLEQNEKLYRTYTLLSNSCISCSACIKRIFISPKVRNSMEAWNDFRGSEWGKVWKRAIHKLGSKILQPVISHFSCTSGIVLWSPLRGIKPGLIIIIEMLIAEVQITTVSNHQEAHTHTHNNDRHWLKGRVQEPQCEKVEKVTLWLWISIKGESKQCQC